MNTMNTIIIGEWQIRRDDVSLFATQRIKGYTLIKKSLKMCILKNKLRAFVN